MTLSTNFDRQTIHERTVDCVVAMVRGWDEGFGGNVDHDTLLVADLGCESIDIVMLVVAIEQAFQRRGLPFDQMLRDGDKYVQDFSVRQLVDFLWRVLN